MRLTTFLILFTTFIPLVSYACNPRVQNCSEEKKQCEFNSFKISPSEKIEEKFEIPTRGEFRSSKQVEAGDYYLSVTTVDGDKKVNICQSSSDICLDESLIEGERLRQKQQQFANWLEKDSNKGMRFMLVGGGLSALGAFTASPVFVAGGSAMALHGTSSWATRRQIEQAQQILDRAISEDCQSNKLVELSEDDFLAIIGVLKAKRNDEASIPAEFEFDYRDESLADMLNGDFYNKESYADSVRTAFSTKRYLLERQSLAQNNDNRFNTKQGLIDKVIEKETARGFYQ